MTATQRMPCIDSCAQFFINSIVAGLVLLSVAKTVATIFAMYMAPNAEMVKNRCREFFNVEKRYADIALKAVQRAVQFDTFDHNCDGQLEVAPRREPWTASRCASRLSARVPSVGARVLTAFDVACSRLFMRAPSLTLSTHGVVQVEDLVQTLARIKKITFDQAWAVAHLIMESADEDTMVGFLPSPLKTSTSNVTVKRQPSGLGKIDFGEYMVASEGEKMMSFEKFLELAPKMATIHVNSDYETCKRAFMRARQVSFPDFTNATTEVELTLAGSVNNTPAAPGTAPPVVYVANP